MSLTIDLYECEPQELEEFVSNPRVSTQDLQFYADQLVKLIEQQKIDDKQAISATPRTRTRHRTTPKSENSDHFDAISVPPTTASRPGRRSRGRKQTNTRRKSPRKMDEDSEDEIDYDVSKPNSVEYEWMSGINDDKSESSSHEDPLLNLDLTNLDDEDYELLLGDPSNHKKSKKSKKKKKKRHKKHKKKKKKRKKRGKTEEGDDDYIISTDDEVHDWGSKEYEQRILQWTGHQLEKEAKSLERQICDEKNRLKHEKKEKETEREREQESEEENLHNLTIEEIQEKFRNKLADIRGNKYGEDPSKLYCICREPYDGTTQMICCDYCQEWYHLSCIGLSADKLAAVEKLKFKCPVCNGANPHDITGRNVSNKGATFDSPKSTPNPPNIVGNAVHLERQNAKYKKLIEELQRRLVQNRANMKKQSKEMTERLSKAKKDIDQERRLRIAVEKHMKGAKQKSDSMVKELGESFQHQKQKESELVNKLKKLEANKKKYKDSASDSKKKMKQLKEEHDARINEYENDIIPSLSEKKKQHEKKNRELEAKITALQQQQVSQQQQAQQSINTTYAQYQKAQQLLTTKSVEATKTQNLNSQLQHKMDALHMQATRNHQQWESISKMKEDKISNAEKQIVALQQQNNALRSNSNMPQVIITTNASNSSCNTPRPPSPIKMPSTPAFLKFNDLELEELKMCRELCQKLLEANLFQVEHMARRASLTRDLFISWVSGMGKTPTVINDLNQATIGALPQLDPHQHLSMNCIRLLLIEIRKQLEAIASDTQTHDSDTINKVKSLLCEFQTASQSYELKMNEFKHLTHTRLLEGCRSQGSVLEMFCVVGTNENNEPKSEWVKVNVCNFDQQNSRVLVRKSTDNSMAYAAIDSATLRLPEHRNLPSNNGNNNGVITLPSMMNASASSPAMAANAHSNGNNNASSHASGSNSNSLPVIARNPPTSHANNSMNVQQPSYWNNSNLMNPQRATPTAIGGMGMMTMGGMGMGGMASGRMNFNGIPSIPTFHGAGNVLPPFSDLQANSNVSVSNISSQHHISNNNTMAINTNNNISVINGAAHNEPIVIDEDDAVSKCAKSSSRKRKRSDEHSKHKSHKKKKKKHKHTDSDTSSSSDSDSEISTDSDTESETESKKHKKAKKSHRKSKKHKKHRHKHKKSKKKKKNIKEEPTKKRKRGRPPKRNGEEDNRSLSLSSTASTRKRRGTKRPLPSSSSAAKPNGSHPHKKRKMNENAYGQKQPALYGNAKSAMGNGGDYDVIDGGGDSDKNDSVCRICKHPGDLVCCEGCPSAYHADCIRPRVKQSWLDSFEDWYCPSCAPRFTYIPLKQEGSTEKWPMYKEPLLKELKDFMKKHPLLERDYCPLFHPSRKK